MRRSDVQKIKLSARENFCLQGIFFFHESLGMSYKNNSVEGQGRKWGKYRKYLCIRDFQLINVERIEF